MNCKLKIHFIKLQFFLIKVFYNLKTYNIYLDYTIVLLNFFLIIFGLHAIFACVDHFFDYCILKNSKTTYI
jgi:hypothetical protein